MALRVPDDLDRRIGIGRTDLLGVRIELREREERVGLPTAEQRRHRDAVRDARRRRLAHECAHLLGERAIGRDIGVGIAPLRREATAQVGLARRRIEPGAEEERRPQLLVDTGDIGVDGTLAEERGLQVVPGDVRCDRVDAVVEAGRHQGECSAVGAAGDADHRITGCVGLHRVETRQVVDDARSVGDLELRCVHRDGAGRIPEAACGVGGYDEAGACQVQRLIGDRLLAATEAMGEDHRGRGRHVREIDVGGQLDQRGIAG